MQQFLGIMALIASIGNVSAQPTVAFPVASIKPNHSGDPGSSWNISPGEMLLHNITLKQLVQIAYNVKDYSMSGPDWLGSERFDINAQTPPELVATKDSQRRDELFHGAMQALMAERFKLAVHHETRTMPAYALVVAKGGLKVEPVESDGGSNEQTKNGKLVATRVSMERMCDWLTRQLNRPVADKTNVKGVFTFRLEYSPEQNLPATTPGEGTAPPDNSGPSIFTALQEQLGLKLQPEKLPVDIVVVDQVARIPTEN